MAKNKKIEITSKILITLYEGHLPIAWGHLEPEGGKTWLGLAVAEGHCKKGNATIIMKALCDYADKGGWELWLTCHEKWLSEACGKFGFKTMETIGHCTYMKRVKKGSEAERS